LIINLKTAKVLGLTVPPDAAHPRRRGDRIGGVPMTACGTIVPLDPQAA
jgi:hypothetical protein